jgi:hypothetical protein
LSFAAEAEASSTAYAKVGPWEISAEAPRCILQGFFGSESDKKIDGLTILWSNNWVTQLPAKGELNVGLVFGKGSSVDESWGSSNLSYEKVRNAYLFTRTFTDPAMADKVLRDLADSEFMGLTSGSTLLKSFKLDASEAITKLRECSEGR